LGQKRKIKEMKPEKVKGGKVEKKKRIASPPVIEPRSTRSSRK
jgi:hypothetical protein